MTPSAPSVHGCSGGSWIKLQRLCRCTSAICASHPPSPGTKGFDPAARSTRQEHLGHPAREQRAGRGAASAASATIRCRIVSSQSRSAAGTQVQTGGTFQPACPLDGRDRLAATQIIVLKTALAHGRDGRGRYGPAIVEIDQRDRLRRATRPKDVGLAAGQ